MINRFKYIGVFVGIVVLMLVTVNMMNFSALGVANVTTDFQNLALKLSIGRFIVIGSAILFGWELIVKGVSAYFRVEVGAIKYRVFFWYTFAEIAIIWSLLRM